MIDVIVQIERRDGERRVVDVRLSKALRFGGLDEAEIVGAEIGQVGKMVFRSDWPTPNQAPSVAAY